MTEGEWVALGFNLIWVWGLVWWLLSHFLGNIHLFFGGESQSYEEQNKEDDEWGFIDFTKK